MSTRKTNVDASDISSAIFDLSSTAPNLVAAGSNQSTALQLDTTSFQRVGTVAASTGVRLPVGFAGTRLAVFNAGANALTVYANTGGFLNNTQNGSLSIPVNRGAEFICVQDNIWVSMLGA